MSFQELIGFLSSPSQEISQVALENLLPVTPAAAGQTQLFTNNDFEGVRALKKLALQKENPWSAQNATIALVNLTENASIRSELASDANAVKGFASKICFSPKASYVRYICMLLNNISREPETLEALKDGPLLLALALTATKNADDEDFDFLVCAMAEFARQDSGALARLLPQMYGQLASAAPNRRSAMASVVKNALFDVNVHEPLAVDTPLIEAIMCRLKGDLTIDAEDFALLPPVVQSSAAARENDEQIVHLLLECLLLLSSSQVGRDVLRTKHTYFIIRDLHKSTNNPDVVQACENFANMVMRGDPDQAEDAEDDGVQEVI